MIRVMLVEDHASSREPLAFMIEQEPDMTVVAQAGTLAQAREGLAVVAPILDYAIVDLELPDGEGADVIRGLRAANRRIQALVLSAYTDLDHVSLAVERVRPVWCTRPRA